ncbi:unnamed protein product [Paramecium octaurelia]|uniref:Uncharacterized protein n=1 Tax=Paramecium octaurelia TaxID=43137 RepID=A0A8S1US41_PAROT|nr:unnamed protein product [Paramecium octaurelia]CAD8166429.1 unnamed protein product [Paramecium octaurelia]
MMMSLFDGTSGILQKYTSSISKQVSSNLMKRNTIIIINRQRQNTKIETYEAKLNSINQKVQIAHSRLQSLQKKLNKIEQTLRNLQIIKNLKQNKIYYQTNSKTFYQDPLKSKKIVYNRLLKEAFETRLMKLLDEQSYKIRLELNKSIDMRLKSNTKIIEFRIQVKIKRREREMLYQEFVGRMGEQLFLVQETLNQEKHQRSESQNQMGTMTQEINNILKLQLAQEQIQRDETERKMIRLLNETCNRVEKFPEKVMIVFI